MKRYLVLFLWFTCFLSGILGFVYKPLTAGKIVTPIVQTQDGYYTHFEFDYKCYNCGAIHHYHEKYHQYELDNKVPQGFIKENKYYGQTVWSVILFLGLIILGAGFFITTCCSFECFNSHYDKDTTPDKMTNWKCQEDCGLVWSCKLANAKFSKFDKFLGNETLS